MIWPLKITADLLGSLAAMVLVPFVVPFADRYTGRLPRAFWWLETPDNRLPGDLKEPTVRKVYERFGFYLTSVYWLGWRNRAYGLSCRLGVRPEKHWPMSVKGNANVGDDNGERGWAWFRLGEAWEFYAVYGKSFGVRIRVGYKLKPFFDNPDGDWTNPVWGQTVLHFSLRRLG